MKGLEIVVILTCIEIKCTLADAANITNMLQFHLVEQ